MLVQSVGWRMAARGFLRISIPVRPCSYICLHIFNTWLPIRGGVPTVPQ